MSRLLLLHWWQVFYMEHTFQVDIAWDNQSSLSSQARMAQVSFHHAVQVDREISSQAFSYCHQKAVFASEKLLLYTETLFLTHSADEGQSWNFSCCVMKTKSKCEAPKEEEVITSTVMDALFTLQISPCKARLWWAPLLPAADPLDISWEMTPSSKLCLSTTWCQDWLLAWKSPSQC